MPCRLNLSLRASGSSKILDASDLRRGDNGLCAAWHHVLRNQPLEDRPGCWRPEERSDADADGEILQMVLPHDHHQAEHAMDADALNWHGGGVAEALDDSLVVLDVKGITVADENSVARQRARGASRATKAGCGCGCP